MKNVTAIITLVISVIALSVAVLPYVISGSKTSINLGSTSLECLNPSILRTTGSIVSYFFPMKPDSGVAIEIDMPSNGIMTGQIKANVSGTFYLINATQVNEMGHSNVPPSYLYSVSGNTFNLDFRLSGFSVILNSNGQPEQTAGTPYNIVFYNPTSNYANLNITQPIEMC